MTGSLKLSTALFAGLLFVLPGQIALAAQDSLPGSDSLPATLRPALNQRYEQTGRNNFSLRQFVSLVEKNYPKLLSANAERSIASAKRLEKSGAFDPILGGISEYQRVQDIFEAGKAKNAIHNESRVDLLTRSGIKVFAGMRLNPNDTKTPFVPSGKAGEYYAGVSVPLLRGLGINEKIAAERIAKIGEPLAVQVFGTTRLEVLLKAAAIYYDWIGAAERIKVARNILTIAQQRLEQVKERVRNGDLAELDIAEAEQETQRRQANLFKHERELQKASISLSVFLWDDKGAPVKAPSGEDIPTLSPRPEPISDEKWLKGRRSALELRPELKRIALEREQAKVDLKLATNLLLPGMDAYLLQGADTGDQGIGPVVKGGIAFSVPLRQRTARGQIQAAKLKIQKLNFDEQLEKQRIQAEVDDAVSAVNTSVERYLATMSETDKAKAVEAGERLKFAEGDSTLFLVNQRERTTAEALIRVIDTHVDYLQSMAAFAAVTCDL